jgi:hypothetical protein
MVRLVNRSDTAPENPHPGPDPNGWVKKIHPITKSRSPLKKNLCKNNSWIFFCAREFFKIIPKNIRGSQKFRIFFMAGEKNQETFFPARSVHALPRKPEFFPSTKNLINPHKIPKFSDVIAIMGNQGYLQTVSLKKPGKLCAKKSDQQKPAKLQAQIAIKRVILEKQPFKTVFSPCVDTTY